MGSEEVTDADLPYMQAPYIFLAACLTALALNLAAPWLLQKPSPVRADRMLLPSSFTPAPVSLLHIRSSGKSFHTLLGAIKSHATWLTPKKSESSCRAAPCPLKYCLV